MAKRSTIAVAVCILLLYAGAIAAGLRVRNFSAFELSAFTGLFHPSMTPKAAWQPPRTLPAGALGESIRSGALLFNETPLYAASHATAKLSCASCHAEGGIQPWASPVVGLPALFPMFNARAGHMISLKDRVQECFVRSENGTPVDYDGPEMTAIVHYIEWLSQPRPGRQAFLGRGLVKLPELAPDPRRGAEIYSAQCAGCHGQDGRGRLPAFPPLWGPESFNDGAGMYGVPKMAAFIQHNMPQNRMGILTPQQAWDVAGFIHAQPRPPFNPAYKSF